MAGTIERQESATTWAVERWWFDRLPKWALVLGVVALGVITRGYTYSRSSDDVQWIAENPWTVDPRVDAPWTYSSPTGPILAWLARMTEWGEMHRFHFGLTIAVLIGCTYLVAVCAGDTAGRLFPVAWFCSPNSWANLRLLGLFDVLTLGAITAMFVGGPAVAFAAGAFGGFTHFEQCAVAGVGVSLLRLGVLGHDRKPIVRMWLGLFVGKVIVTAYTSWLGVSGSARLDFVREVGLEGMIDNWRYDVSTYLWAVFNVLWVAVIWMLFGLDRDRRAFVALAFLAAALPVMLTFDIGRVFRVVTWPIVMLTILYAAQHTDRRLVQRGALLLLIASVFVPQVEIWQRGVVPWTT